MNLMPTIRKCHCGNEAWWVRDWRVRCKQCATVCRCSRFEVEAHDLAAEAAWPGSVFT